MGRPVTKRKFGDPAVVAGDQIYIQGWFEGSTAGAEEQCFIVKQTATRTFRVESVANGDQGEVRLVLPTGTIGSQVVAGEGYLDAANTGGRAVATIAINAGGTGYTALDVITVVGGTGTAATIRVDSVSVGVIDGATLLTTGDYTVNAGATGVGVTGPGNDDATFDLTYVDYTFLLSNKNVKLFKGGRRKSYTIDTGGNPSDGSVSIEGT